MAEEYDLDRPGMLETLGQLDEGAHDQHHGRADGNQHDRKRQDEGDRQPQLTEGARGRCPPRDRAW
jgi:hypothetical protein